jgi:hypothetical protein
MSGVDPDLHVLALYARLAANRAVDARFALGRCENRAELMAQSAQALEDAAGTLSMLSELYANGCSTWPMAASTMNCAPRLARVN